MVDEVASFDIHQVVAAGHRLRAPAVERLAEGVLILVTREDLGHPAGDVHFVTACQLYFLFPTASQLGFSVSRSNVAQYDESSAGGRSALGRLFGARSWRTSMLSQKGTFLRRMSASAETEARVLIVGTGLTGSLTCYYLRSLLKKEVHIDMTDNGA